MKIESSLLNDKDFVHVKDSLLNISAIDNEGEFRVNAIEYINDSAENDDDMFFYDMLPFTRFLEPTSNDIAYTTPDGLIYLNCPGKHLGKNLRHWDFTFDHECLHQLWDTFDVGNEIKKLNVEFNHFLLNIASDCVINDYLVFYREKSMPDGLITPEYLQEKFGVTYDRLKDTQLSLYMKLLPKAKEMENDEVCKKSFDGTIKPKKVEKDDEDGTDGGGGGNPPEKHSKDYIQGWTDAIQDVLDKKVDPTDESYKPKSTKNEEYDNGYNDCMENIKNGLENGVTLKKGKGGKTGDLPNIPWEIEDDQSSGKPEDDESDDKDQKSGDDTDEDPDGDKQEENEESPNNKQHSDDGKGNEKGKIVNADLEEIRKKHKDIIEKYRKKFSGPLGKFIKQCKSSAKGEARGFVTGTTGRGLSAWNKQLNSHLNSYIKTRVYKKQCEWRQTFTRPKRGAGLTKFGEPLKPGRKRIENQLEISISFFVDVSGSMYNCIDRVWDALYTITDALTKRYKSEKVVSGTKYNIYAFNTKIHEIEYGKKMRAGGDNVPFEKLLQFIKQNTKNNLINIILTDAGYSVNKSVVKNFLKELKGIFIFITNIESPDMRKCAEENKSQLKYILADGNFNINSDID